ncbi:ATP-binding protein [Hazenella coriacea]|uniref:Tetratricopeptide repeat protein n=1 Tax=Hazenella coriacea TaxID=1179467 RepID=A0A4R3L3C6_9BACL|nr:ATP-binding protein [Hazenella coriacea]TCS94191.1 tetratricopeptide repeat protein [Hazenella coriacea]
MGTQDHQLESLLQALQLSPNNIPLKKIVSEHLLSAGRTTDAITYLQEILTQIPNDKEAYSALARAYFDLGQFDQVIQLLQTDQVPDLPAEALLLVSKSFFEQEEYERAGELYEEALNLNPQVKDEGYQEELKQKQVQVKQKLRVVEFKPSTRQDDLFEKPEISFKDIGGLEELKEQIRMNIIYPFQNPDLFRSYGKKIGGGLLLYGPPGCGKTHIARATAGECNAHFVSINIHDILDMYIGQSERNLHDIFETARQKRPSIIFIDELDAIGSSRQQSTSTYMRSLTNQLLSELDGVHTDNEEILVLGATNTPWFVDSAMRRPGRFDRVLFVAPPDLQARVEILHIQLSGKPIEEIDFVKVAKKMEKFSGADIRSVCDWAIDLAITDAMKTGKKRKVTTNDLLEALKKVKSSTLEWLSTAKNYATYSNESGIYDDILDYLNKHS